MKRWLIAVVGVLSAAGLAYAAPLVGYTENMVQPPTAPSKTGTCGPGVNSLGEVRGLPLGGMKAYRVYSCATIDGGTFSGGTVYAKAYYWSQTKCEWAQAPNVNSSAAVDNTAHCALMGEWDVSVPTSGDRIFYAIYNTAVTIPVTLADGGSSTATDGGGQVDVYIDGYTRSQSK